MESLACSIFSDEVYKVFCEKLLKDLKKDFSIQEIAASLGGTDSLSSCISAIMSIAKFLSHSCGLVRNFAAKAICMLIKKACEFLLQESDPIVIMKMGKLLLKVIKQIEALCKSGAIDLSVASGEDLSFAKNILRILEISDHEREGDEFVSDGFNQPVNKIFKRLYCDLFTKKSEIQEMTLKRNDSPAN